ncbi:hypothetical protein BH24BAC1_BH24BAC1_12050 [soil metagenome]|jgi:hypothetical protein
MESLLIHPDSQEDLTLLLALAKKMGISARVITEEEKEDLGLLKAMEEGRTTDFVSRSSILDMLNEDAD